jgi:hypothetical protein
MGELSPFQTSSGDQAPRPLDIMGNGNSIVASTPPVAHPPPPLPRPSSSSSSSAIADFAFEVISLMNGGILMGGITFDDVMGLCGFLVVKYPVADISIPSRLSPSSIVDKAWHRLVLFPVVYDIMCCHAH